MNWMSAIFAKNRPDELPSPSTGFHETEGIPEPMRVGNSDLRSARELVYTTAQDVARMYGISPDWLSFEVLTIADDEKAYFQLQVIARQWDEYLFVRSYAFELAVMKRLREINMLVARAVRAVLWRTSPDAGCPYDELPGAEAWTVEAVAGREALRKSLFTAQPAQQLPSHLQVSGNKDAPETMPAFVSGSVASGVLLDSSVGAANSEFVQTKPASTQAPDDFEHTSPVIGARA
jgi:hypothetical protein